MQHAAGRAPYPQPLNEPELSYAPGTPERAALRTALETMAGENTDMPCVIGGRDVTTGRLEAARMPHDHQHVLGQAHLAGTIEVRAAIDAALKARADWANWPAEERAAIFLRAAERLSGDWRQTLNAATMLGQSKNVQQAEVDSACELIDFWRYNVDFMQQILVQQPQNADGAWTHIDYRPLEGFVYAVSPFNFTAIAGNLPSAPALMGNTVVWKPSPAAKLSAHYIMKLLQAAGLPDGVINLVYGDAAEVTSTVMAHPMLAGVHFTGSTQVFDRLQHAAATHAHRSIPRLVGETGGKNFILAHASADPEQLVPAILRGAFEYQGQKCSAPSRLYLPESLWPGLRERLCDEIATIRMGDVRDFGNFMTAVIHEGAWSRHMEVFEAAKSDPDTEILTGGRGDQSVGYFIEPTLLRTTNPAAAFMKDEYFGPITCAHIYPDAEYDALLNTIDTTADYALTGAIFASDRAALQSASNTLRYTAGNLYLNDKPTGALVGQQPFGGSRASGTNDKAGSTWSLARWTSPRTVKETFNASRGGYAHPFMAAED